MCQHCHCRIHPQNSGEQNTSHSKRLRSLRGAESEADEMIKQEQLRPLQLSGAPQTSETIPAHPHSGFFFHHFFFIFLRIYQIFMENIVRFNIFCFHSYRIRIPHSGAKRRKKKKKRKQNLKKLRIGRYLHTQWQSCKKKHCSRRNEKMLRMFHETCVP